MAKVASGGKRFKSELEFLGMERAGCGLSRETKAPYGSSPLRKKLLASVTLAAPTLMRIAG
jgi:hypothetical protein